MTPTLPPTSPPTAPPTATPTITPTAPPVAPSCIAVNAYDESWIALTNAQLSTLIAGDHVWFCVSGSATGTFDMAQFKINTTIEQVVTTHDRPGSNDFCQSYTILPTDTTVTVQAKIHDINFGWIGENF